MTLSDLPSLIAYVCIQVSRVITVQAVQVSIAILRLVTCIDWYRVHAHTQQLAQPLRLPKKTCGSVFHGYLGIYVKQSMKLNLSVLLFFFYSYIGL